MSCKCCAGPCRKKAVKKRGGKKPKKAPKQPVVSISLGQPQAPSIPRLAPTFQSSINTPLSEQKVGSPMIKVPSRITGIGREIETQTVEPEKVQMTESGSQTAKITKSSRAEKAEAGALEMSVMDFRISRL